MSFAKHGIQTVLVRTSLVIFVLVAGIINARWLGPEGVGVFALLMLVRVFAFRFGNLGFGTAIVFFVARKNVSTRQILWLVLFVGCIASVLSGVAILIIWRYSFSPWNDIKPGLFYLCLPSIPMLFFTNYLTRILSGKLRITAANIANVITSVGNVVFLGVLVVAFKLGIIGAILAVLLSDLLTILYCFLYVRKLNGEASEMEQPSSSKEALVYRLWCYGRWSYLLMLLGFFIEELPLILLKNFSATFAHVGLFSRARGLARQSRLVATPVSNVLFPYTTSSTQENATRRTNTLCRNSLVVILPTVALVTLCIKPIILILYGEPFLPAANIFYALTPGLFIWPLGYFLGIHVVASGKPRMLVFASLVTLGVAVMVSWFLVPKYGAVGAGLSTSVIYTTQTFSYLLIYIKVTGASFSDVLLPRRADWLYYRHILTMPASIFIKKAN